MKTKRIIPLLLTVLLILSFALIACTDEQTPTPNPVTYRVFFEDNASNVENGPDPQNVVSGGYAVRPPDPSRNGYTFEGWYTTQSTDANTEFNFETTVITAETYLYAKWEIAVTYYNVTLNYNYENSPAATVLRVASGGQVTEPDMPERDGHAFDTWSTQATIRSPYTFSSSVNVSFVLYAFWDKEWSISYDYNYPGSSSVTYTYKDNESVEEISPERTDFIFGGWFLDEEYTQPYTYEEYLTSDVYVYAKWSEAGDETYNVTYDYNYSGAPAAIVREVQENGIASTPGGFAREGYVLRGWFTDPSCTNAYVMSTPVTSDIQLYALWAARYTYSIDLNYEESSAPYTSTITEGDAIPAKPTDPTRTSSNNDRANPVSGYVFAGWATTVDGEPDFNGFGGAMTGNLTLYAQWETSYMFSVAYTDLSNVEGAGYSGGESGTGMLYKDNQHRMANAESGYFISYLYRQGVTLTFEIESDSAASASFIVRMSGEGSEDFGLTDDEYLITLNDRKVEYGSVFFDGVFGIQDEQKRPFDDTFEVTVDLVEGKNIIKLITNNNITFGGAINASAPIIDCLKFTTKANLSWTPLLGNTWHLDG